MGRYGESTMSNTMQLAIQSKHYVSHLVNMNDLKEISHNKGKYFFESKTMKWFNSRILNDVYVNKTDKDINLVYFITSEKFDLQSPRRFTIRKFHLSTGDVDNLGEFQQFPTKYSAISYLYRFLT